MKTALYARVSTEEQIQITSIDNQLEHLRNNCQQRGFTIYKKYGDLG